MPRGVPKTKTEIELILELVRTLEKNRGATLTLLTVDKRNNRITEQFDKTIDKQ